MYDIETINKHIDEIAEKHYGTGFKFRPHQKETIANICNSWLTGTENVILQAPTGSGKSIVAMTVAAVLSKYYKKKGYILISDLSLLEQYQKDVDRYFPEWALLRGQQTYDCDMNGLNFKVGACKLAGCTSYMDIFQKFPQCAPTCEYIQLREKAIKSDVTICTYAFWLVQQNTVKPKMREACAPVPFDDRDFLICDEGHKLVEIVQQHFAPKLGVDDMGKIESIIQNSGMESPTEFYGDVSEARTKIFDSTDNQSTFDAIVEYSDIMAKVNDYGDSIKRSFEVKNDEDDGGKKYLSKSEKTLIYNCDFVEEHCTKIQDYIDIINQSGVSNLIKNDSESGNSLTLNCINESYLLDKYFHKHCKKRMYMSATIGDPVVYANDIRAVNYVPIELPPVFDYTNSPIFYVDNYKMSYQCKNESLPRIVELIEAILEMYPDFRGIVQTGSYAFAKALKDSVAFKYKNRLLLYDNSSEKNDVMETFKIMKNKVLVGPSLIEGLSLDDDLCRFQIIMKIPYPSLKDKFVAAKMKYSGQWYSNTTAISILQGVGRGVRNEKDWCVTFILDGCFTNLMRQSYNMFPKDFMQRIQLINPNSILNRS